jgi:diguanylate cyclase (GGDEF)-like protein
LITREQADQLKDQLVEVLAEDASNADRLLARLDQISLETGIEAYSALLLILTQLAFSEEEAREHWEAILGHRHELSLKLGRDVGLRVALVDHFMNVNRRLVHPTLIDLELFDSVRRSAGRDTLTGLADQRSFHGAVQTELRRARRYGQPVAVVLFDVDDFNEANQALGKLVCDRLLRETAMLLGNKIRDIDIASRPGEDELALVLPETDRNGALLVAERFRREIEQYFNRREAGGAPVGLTVSAGIACYPDDATTSEDLLAHAAQALYRAKVAGKNTVQLYHPERRRYLRFDLAPERFEVEVLAPRPAGGPALNLSRSGVMFTCPEPLAVGEEIEIRVLALQRSAGTHAMRMRGQVVRLEELPPPEPGAQGGHEADRYEVGMAFDLDRAEGEAELLRFLEQARGRGPAGRL